VNMRYLSLVLFSFLSLQSFHHGYYYTQTLLSPTSSSIAVNH
jgi:hypothetical protein